jgi:hypothetical protein
VREDNSLGVFENRVLRRYFGRRAGVSADWMRLQYKELRDLYLSSDIIRVVIKPR